MYGDVVIFVLTVATLFLGRTNWEEEDYVTMHMGAKLTTFVVFTPRAEHILPFTLFHLKRAL
jgi:hypothetical protein